MASPKHPPLKLVDYGGRAPKDIRKEARWARLRKMADPRRPLNYVHSKVRASISLGLILTRSPAFLLLSLALLFTVVGLAYVGHASWALVPALAGFGLSLATLGYAGIPWARATLNSLRRSVRLALFLGVAALFSLAGFSSGAVVALVLFLGGFASTHILWSFARRLTKTGRKSTGSVATAAADPLPTLGVFALDAAVVVPAALALGSTRLDPLGIPGAAMVGCLVGLVAGLAPTDIGLLRQLKKQTAARWYAFGPRRAIRDILFAGTVIGLVGHEVSVALRGQETVPLLSIGLLLGSYLLIAIRQIPAIGRRLARPDPLLLTAFTTLLLFAPALVLLTSGVPTITYIYGGSEAAGLLVGFITITARGVPGVARIGEKLRRYMPGRSS